MSQLVQNQLEVLPDASLAKDRAASLRSMRGVAMQRPSGLLSMARGYAQQSRKTMRPILSRFALDTVGDFTRWKEHDAYSTALERLLRDLKVERG